jgi:hypothetical protein
MATRTCSCCGQPYTDEEGHDLDKCIETCKSQLHQAERTHAAAREDLERAYERRIANLKELLRRDKC